ncbi:MAG TPA: hypothetical protein DDW30_08415 [Clostridiales bacterium]|nr:hypothetical protein [Clostridiales bacterium]
MGFFKKLFSARRAVTRAMEEQEARLSALAALPPEELARQEDATLCEVLSFQNDKAVTVQFGPPHKRRQSLADCYNALPEASRVYALVDLFALYMETDGLCGVLTSDLRPYAWELPSLLRTVGAAPHADLLASFYTDNGIDPREVDSFLLRNDLEHDYAAQEARYPYAAFNRAFSALPPLLPLLAAYARSRVLGVGR